MTAIYIPAKLKAAVDLAQAFSGEAAALQVLKDALHPPAAPLRQVDGTFGYFVHYEIKELWRALVSSYPHFINHILTWLKAKLTGGILTSYMMKWLLQQPAFFASAHYNFSLVTVKTAHLVPGEIYREYCRRKQGGIRIDSKFRLMIKQLVDQDGRLAERFDVQPSGNLMWFTHERVRAGITKTQITLQLTFEGVEHAIGLPVFTNPACSFIGLAITQFILGKDAVDLIPSRLLRTAGLVTLKKIKDHPSYFKLKRPKALEMPKPTEKKKRRKRDE